MAVDAAGGGAASAHARCSGRSAAAPGRPAACGQPVDVVKHLVKGLRGLASAGHYIAYRLILRLSASGSKDRQKPLTADLGLCLTHRAAAGSGRQSQGGAASRCAARGLLCSGGDAAAPLHCAPASCGRASRGERRPFLLHIHRQVLDHSIGDAHRLLLPVQHQPGVAVLNGADRAVRHAHRRRVEQKIEDKRHMQNKRGRQNEQKLAIQFLERLSIIFFR
ncbi:MAG: hypothetical protein BWY83_00427 [bacterium ADurb.Bin478]|nr:MAG: hypothetical protein BWY83_00427 [bacterium ADurb.Bin478]